MFLYTSNNSVPLVFWGFQTSTILHHLSNTTQFLPFLCDRHKKNTSLTAKKKKQEGEKRLNSKSTTFNMKRSRQVSHFQFEIHHVSCSPNDLIHQLIKSVLGKNGDHFKQFQMASYFKAPFTKTKHQQKENPIFSRLNFPCMVYESANVIQFCLK